MHSSEYIIHQDRCRFVSIQQRPCSFQIGYRQAHAVRVGVAPNHQVGLAGFCLFHGQGQSGRLLGVGRVNRWKISVGHRLGLDEFNVLKSTVLQCFWDERDGGAVQRRKNHFQIALAGVRPPKLAQLGQIGAVHFFSHGDNASGATRPADGFQRGLPNLFQERTVVGGDQLPAVGTVHFVSVVGLGIVGGG